MRYIRTSALNPDTQNTTLTCSFMCFDFTDSANDGGFTNANLVKSSSLTTDTQRKLLHLWQENMESFKINQPWETNGLKIPHLTAVNILPCAGTPSWGTTLVKETTSFVWLELLVTKCSMSHINSTHVRDHLFCTKDHLSQVPKAWFTICRKIVSQEILADHSTIAANRTQFYSLRCCVVVYCNFLCFSMFTKWPNIFVWPRIS